MQSDREVGRAAVLGNEDRRASVVVTGHRFDVGTPAQALLERYDPRSRRRRGDRSVVDDDDHRGHPQAGVLQSFLRLHRLGRRVVGAVGVEAVGDRAAERSGEQEEGDREEPDAAGTPIGEAGEGVEHQLLLFVWVEPRRRVSIRSHQSANHSANSIPPCSTISG